MAEWLAIEKAAKAANLSTRTIQRYVKSGKIKSRKVGKSRIVLKDSIDKIISEQNFDEYVEDTEQPQPIAKNELTNKKSENLLPPEGYVIIDNETLDSLRFQIKSLTESVSQMQSTQKLLIEKGLNLSQEPKELPISVTRTTEDKKEAETNISEKIKISEDPLSKINDSFFTETKKAKNNSNKSLLIIFSATFLLIVLIIIVNVLN